MKITLLACLGLIVLVLGALGQTPTAPAPTAQPTAGTTAALGAALAATATPALSAASRSEGEESIEDRVTRKLKHKFGIDIDVDHGKTHISRHDKADGNGGDDDLGSIIAIPIVAIIFTTLFGAPVLVVAAVMFFSYLKSRSLHRTVRTMVEKGQEVPPALFAPPQVVRARSDLRRGVVLVMVGFGLMIFFGAVNDWEGGVWSLGVIPFVIGLGYLLVWKLEGRRDKVPPLP
jgi:hypothetical protein